MVLIVSELLDVWFLLLVWIVILVYVLLLLLTCLGSCFIVFVYDVYLGCLFVVDWCFFVWCFGICCY